MLQPGNTVTHPLFPQWGKGEITAIFFDTQIQKPIAKVMWRSAKDGHVALHTMEHLQLFVDSATTEIPAQLQLPLR